MYQNLYKSAGESLCRPDNFKSIGDADDQGKPQTTRVHDKCRMV